MPDEQPQSPRELLERERTRLLHEAAVKEAAAREAAEKAAAIEHDLAELDRIAAKYNLVVQASQDAESYLETVADLALVYQQHSKSPWQELGFASRTSYGYFLKYLVRSLGTESIESLDAARLQRAFDDWKAGGHLPMARSLIGQLGRLASFGSNVLKHRGCRELRLTLHDMRFEQAPRTSEQPVTREWANALRATAHREGLPSMALAQALQFECPQLSQKDIIGEWVPVGDDGTSEIISDRKLKKKWVRGLRWQAIDDNDTLRHFVTSDLKPVTIDLRDKPMVMEELARPENKSKRGSNRPIVIYEPEKRPYSATGFRHIWRQLADKSGIPKAVKNRNSRVPTRRNLITPGQRLPLDEQWEKAREERQLASREPASGT